MLRRLQRLGEGMAAVGDLLQRIRASAEIVGPVGEIHLRPDHPDLELAGEPALADARVEYRRLEPRVAADDQQRVRALDPGDGGVEEIAGAAGRIERDAVLAA